MSARRLCVLRSGGEYGPEHVRWLARQVPGLAVLTDVPVSGVPNFALVSDWPGWWAKMELFRPDLPGDVLYFDLDTVVLGGLDQLEVGRTTVLRDFYRPGSIGSGLIYIEHRHKREVIEKFLVDPARHMAECRTRENWGDQGFLRKALPEFALWQDLRPDLVWSYKADIVAKRKTPRGVVCFHGKPRPWAVNEDWVPRLREASAAS